MFPISNALNDKLVQHLALIWEVVGGDGKPMKWLLDMSFRNLSTLEERREQKLTSRHLCFLKISCWCSYEFESSYGNSDLICKTRIRQCKLDFCTRSGKNSLFRNKIPGLKFQYCHLVVV